MKPHPHAELIKAWADGAEIQTLVTPEWGWEDVKNPRWDENNTYRIKPQPKPDVVIYGTAILSPDCAIPFISRLGYLRSTSDNVKFIFDGESNVIKSAEVI